MFNSVDLKVVKSHIRQTKGLRSLLIKVRLKATAEVKLSHLKADDKNGLPFAKA